MSNGGPLPTLPARIHHATVEAYNNETGQLIYTVHLPELTRTWLRELLRLSPRAAVHGGLWPLDSDQVAKLRKLREFPVDLRKFDYHLDGDSTVEMRMQETRRTRSARSIR